MRCNTSVDKLVGHKKTISIKSRKAKARRLQNEICDDIKTMFKLTDNEVRPALMGESGEDIKITNEGRTVFPFSVECKAQEKLNIWSALHQAKINAKNIPYLMVFTRNKHNIYVCMEWNTFLDIVV